MASARDFATGLAAALLLGLLSGCGAGLHQGSYAVRPTPADPPSIPDRKPATPAWFQAVAAEAARSYASAPADRSARPSRYRVAPGDTVLMIADRFGVPMRRLVAVNRLQPPYRLLPGQSLAIPRQRVHEVVAGDTLYAIARRYDADMAKLVRLNRLTPPYKILRGQKVLIPGRQDSGGVQVAALQTQASPTPAATAVAVEPLDGDEGTDAVRQGDEVSRTAAVPAPGPSAPEPSTPVPPPPPLHGGKFLWPVSGPLLSSYGPQSSGLHNDGVNIAAARGTPVRAAENGVVAYVGNELRGFGNLLLIKHSDGWVTAYAHTDEILVRRGQRVERGQVVARVGNSGSVSEPQLHFEVRKGVQTIDPARLLETRAVASS